MLALGTAGLTVACADMPTTPESGVRSGSGPAYVVASATTASKLPASDVTDRHTSGDTVVTTFVLQPDGLNVLLPLGNGNQITFPAGAKSVCDPATSSYGIGTWDSPCAPLAQAITITAKSWTTSAGLPRVDFDRAVRFVPGRARVVLDLKNPAMRFPAAGQQVIEYCPTAADACINESATDPSVATQQDPTNGFWYRRVKHFSGYNVVVN